MLKIAAAEKKTFSFDPVQQNKQGSTKPLSQGVAYCMYSKSVTTINC
jgi:hypothetical protein